ncbi:MAG: ABC transporter permease subunit [Eubacteriales bacterium]|nr:ABC transporter permease subunit [Eubacteriales bacterium]
MKTLFKKELRLSRRLLCIWMAIMLVLCVFCWFESMSLKDSLGELSGMLEQFPRLLVIMFGIKADLSTAIGWYSCLYFWTTILAVAYGMSLGVSCVAKEKNRGTAAYLFTKPVSRRQIVLAKAASSGVNLAAFAAFTGLCNYFLLVLPMGGLEQRGAMAATTAGLFLTQVLFYDGGLLLASLFRSYKVAVRASAAAAVGAYALCFTAEYTGLRLLDYLTPLRYFDVYEVTLHGLSLPRVLLTLLITAACVAAAVNRWDRREL